MENVNIFRNLHNQPLPLILANAWDAGSARIFEDLGAPAIATTSAGVAWALGYPDGGKLPAEEQARLAKNITRIIKVPFSMDFENGYSDDPNIVAENIKPLLDAGVSGINIEDGTDNPELLAKKIEAIRNTVIKYNTDLFINARTDVYLASLVEESKRIDETCARAHAYKEAGADGLFVPFLTDGVAISTLVNRINLPLNIMALSGLPGTKNLGQLGVKRLSAGSGISQITWNAAANLAKAFLDTGDSNLLAENYMPHGKLQELFQ